MRFTVVKTLVASLLMVAYVNGHGRLLDPPGRSSLWRFGYDSPANYDDNQLFCGGFQDQWENNGGKCGICGDPWEQPEPRDNEAGGLYGLGYITKNYKKGQTIDIVVELTANHDGWFEFRLCENNNVKKDSPQSCFDEHLLELESGGTRFPIPPGSPSTITFVIPVKLPPTVTCSQCVVQWHYNTANSWGTCLNGTADIGCGPQECFRGCSDVSIA